MIQILRGRGEKGFTLIEVMVVIAIIGILAAIAIPNFITYRQRGYDASAHADIRNAFTMAQAYFNDFDNGAVDLTKLKAYGYIQSPNVTLGFVGTTNTDLELTAVHPRGSRTYTIGSTGVIAK